MYKQKYKEGQQIHKDIYLYICRYIKEHRYAPSYKEIAGSKRHVSSDLHGRKNISFNLRKIPKQIETLGINWC